MKRPNVPRREKPVSELSLIGKDTLRWVQLEVERRFCGTNSEVVSDAPVVKSNPDTIMLQLDIRTIKSQHISADEKYQALIHYVEAYSDFGMQCAEYKYKALMKYEAEKAE